MTRTRTVSRRPETLPPRTVSRGLTMCVYRCFLEVFPTVSRGYSQRRDSCQFSDSSVFRLCELFPAPSELFPGNTSATPPKCFPWGVPLKDPPPRKHIRGGSGYSDSGSTSAVVPVAHVGQQTRPGSEGSAPIPASQTPTSHAQTPTLSATPILQALTQPWCSKPDTASKCHTLQCDRMDLYPKQLYIKGYTGDHMPGRRPPSARNASIWARQVTSIVIHDGSNRAWSNASCAS